MSRLIRFIRQAAALVILILIRAIDTNAQSTPRGPDPILERLDRFEHQKSVLQSLRNQHLRTEGRCVMVQRLYWRELI